MRALHVNYEFPGVTSNCGGGGRVTALLDEHLPAFDIESRVVTDESDGHWSTFPARAHRKVHRAMQEFDPDVLHGHFSLPSSVGLPLIADRHDLPLVVSVMGADVFDPSRFYSLRWATDRVNGRIFEQADAVVAPSHDMAGRVQSKHDIEPRVIPYGIRPDRWTWRSRDWPEEPTVLTVARQVQRKRLQRGIHAIEELRHRGFPDAEYRLVGEGPKHDLLSGIAADCPWLEAPGYVEDLQAEFDAADLFLLPSDHEAFGIVVCEALAAGLPVVTTDTGGQAEIVADDVGHATAPDPAELGASLAYVCNHYEAFQAATEGYVERWYDTDRMARDYTDLYRDITESRELVI